MPDDPPRHQPPATGHGDGQGPAADATPHGPKHTAGQRVSRRAFLAGAGALAAAGIGGGLATAELGGSSAPRPRPALPRHDGTATTTADTFTGTTPDGVPVPMSRAIVAENLRPGSPWWIGTPQVPRSIEGFTDHVSAQQGDGVTLFANTTAPSFHVEAYRMGWYQGVGGRLVWRSDEVPGVRQPEPEIVPTVNTVQCHWSPSLVFTVGGDWLPGAYLLKLVGATGEEQFVPLCVRDDASHAAFVIQDSVTTWQAYNRWGGYSLYYGNPGSRLSFVHQPGGGASFADRARIVSFDRPYDWDWASGAADFIGNELPVIYQAERLGLDVTYWTDLDLHLRPQLLANHRCLFSLGHDEYWSLQMRDGATSALQQGTNLAFLGANACYRQIRVQDSPVGPNRLQVCYKDAAEDPMNGVDDAVVTGPSWVSPPTDWAESQLIGAMYQDVGADADMVVWDASHWTLAGTGLAAGQHLPKVVQGEFDRYDPAFATPPGVDVVAHSPVPNRGNNYSDVTWYTVAGGGGVFDSGNATWVGSLSDTTGFPTDIVPAAHPGVTAPLLRVMENLYSVLGAGPASASHPSSGSAARAYGRSGAAPGPNLTPSA